MLANKLTKSYEQMRPQTVDADDVERQTMTYTATHALTLTYPYTHVHDVSAGGGSVLCRLWRHLPFQEVP